MSDLGGVWRTVGGRRIFIKDGQTLASAMRKSGKFGKKVKDKNKEYKIPQETLDKFKNREDGNYYVAEIKPEHFLKITSNENLIKSIEKETTSYGEFDIEKMNKGYAVLEVDLENGKVMNHEGRHRMQLLKNAGYEKAQIIIMSKKHNYDESKAHNFSSLHLKHQMENENFETSVVDLKILNKK